VENFMVSPVNDRPSRVPATCEALAVPLAAILQELRTVLGPLSADCYTQRMGAPFADASIGGHVRHCLDHARAMVDGRRAGVVDYDHRTRGTRIEAEPAEAIAEIDSLTDAVHRLANVDAAEPVGVAIMPTRDGPAAVLSSTLARELAFVLSHTIHHNATIRGMAVSAGCAVPESFGYAPSTLAHKDRCPCVR
jgi:uncharacterized damage-inducible protein DinB